MYTETDLVNFTKEFYNNLDKTSNLQQAIDVIDNLLASSAKKGFRVISVGMNGLRSQYLIDINLDDFRRLSVYYRLKGLTVHYKGISDNAELTLSWIE